MSRWKTNKTVAGGRGGMAGSDVYVEKELPVSTPTPPAPSAAATSQTCVFHLPVGNAVFYFYFFKTFFPPPCSAVAAS